MKNVSLNYHFDNFTKKKKSYGMDSFFLLPEDGALEMLLSCSVISSVFPLISYIFQRKIEFPSIFGNNCG